MSEETLRQSIIDEEHLKLLSLGYMVSGGFAAMFSLFGLFYVFMGAAMTLAISSAPVPSDKGGAPPAFVGWIFVGIGLAIFVVAVGVAIARFWVVRSIRRRKSRTFCLVVAAIGCLEFPYGTLLSVLSFITLGRESVVRLFTPTAPGPRATS